MAEVTSDDVYFLTSKSSFRFPIVPPPLKNHGNYVMSISKLVRWLGEKVEEKGAFIIPELGGRELLFEGDVKKRARWRQRAERAEALLEVQKNIAALLGTPPESETS